MTETLANAIVTIICLVVLCLVELAIIWTYAKDNAELRARADYDAETVRFLNGERG
jgi:hypothetical protein